MQTKASIVTRAVRLLAAAALAAIAAYPAFGQQPAPADGAQASDWFPSRWGADDEIGAANHMTPQRIIEAARLVKTGQVYELGITVSPDTPAFPPRDCKLYVVQPGQQAGGSLGHTKTTYNDDILNCWIGIGSQLDGLGHIGIDNVHYNGHKVADFAQPTGLTKLGIEKIPPMVARGVLLDMAAFFGTDVVKEGTAYNREQNTERLAKDKVHEFMFVLGHNKYKGAVQSMINPVAIH